MTTREDELSYLLRQCRKFYARTGPYTEANKRETWRRFYNNIWLPQKHDLDFRERWYIDLLVMEGVA